MPLSNRRGIFFCLLTKNFSQVFRRTAAIKFRRRFNLIFDIESQFVEVVNVRRPREIFFVGHLSERLEISPQLLHYRIRHEKTVERRRNFLRGLCRFYLKALLFVSRLDCRRAQTQFITHLPNLRLIDLQSPLSFAALYLDIKPQFLHALLLERFSLPLPETRIVNRQRNVICQLQFFANLGNTLRVNRRILLGSQSLLPIFISGSDFFHVVGRVEFQAEHFKNIPFSQTQSSS